MTIVKRKKDTMIGFRLKDEQAREFKAICALKRTSIQKVLENAVEEYMKSAKKETD